MNQTDVIKEVMSISNITQKDLTEKLGLKSQSSVSAYLKSDMRVNTFVKLLDILGYQVTVKKIDQESGLNQEWILTSEK